MKLDTRSKKPKIYNVAALSVFEGAVLAAMLQLAESVRLLWANLSLAIYFALVIVMLVDALRKQIQWNLYSYNTILYTGFILFSLFLLVMHARAALQSRSLGLQFHEQEMVHTLLDSAKGYMRLTSPFLFAFSGALFVSNIALIRHEGRRFVNILGIILSFLLVAGEVLILLLDRFLTRSGNTQIFPHLLVNLGAAFYLYFECMTIGTIFADTIAARYVPEPDKDFLIILGCGLRKDGTPTPLLKGRLELALDFYHRQLHSTGRDAIFVCSGGQGPDEVCPEAASMRDYLLERGLDDKHILVEDQSTDTAENMRFSKEKIDAVNPNGKVAFFTTNYHVFRAGLKARRVKMRALGMGAPTRWYFWPNAAVREFVGLLTEHWNKQAAVLGTMTAAYILLTILAYR